MYYVDENNEPVEIYDVNEMDNKYDQEQAQESINTDEVPSTADASDREEQT